MNKLIKKLSIALTICLSLLLCIVPAFADDETEDSDETVLKFSSIKEYVSYDNGDEWKLITERGDGYIHAGNSYKYEIVYEILDGFNDSILEKYKSKYGLKNLSNIDYIIPLEEKIEKKDNTIVWEISFTVSNKLTENKEFSVDDFAPGFGLNFKVSYEKSTENNTTNNITTNTTENSDKAAPDTSVR